MIELLATAARSQVEYGSAPDPRDRLISIHCTGDRPAAVLPELWAQVTHIELNDVEETPNPLQVDRIVRAVQAAHSRGTRMLVIQCDAGFSRSVGVARAVSEILGLPYDSPFPGNVTLKLAVRKALTHLG